MNDLFKFLHHKYSKDSTKWYPFLSVFYLTNSCNFKCPYCSDGYGNPYYTLSKKNLPSNEVLKVLKSIRTNCDNIVLTGGEPLLHPDFDEIILKIKDLKFKEVVLTTNGYNIDKFIPNIIQSVTTLVFSIDTLNAKRADNWFGVGEGTFNKIISSIQDIEKIPERKFEIVISAVATPENISDLYEVYDFSQKHKFTFAVAPQLVGVKAHEKLQNNEEYIQFFNFLIQEKKKRRKIFGTTLYLTNMRDLKKFTCKPFTMLVVSPLGDVYYPCLEIGNYAGNLLVDDNLHKIRGVGLKTFGEVPNCDTRCHSACALGFGLIFSKPYSTALDVISYGL